MSTKESTGPIRILYSDDHLLIIDKPPGMLTHTHGLDRTSPTVVDVLRTRLGHSIYTVHRLDRMTTGAMILACTRGAASELSRQFRDREVEKRYLAVVRGHLDDNGSVELPIAHPVHGEDLHARTDYATVARGVVHEPVGRYEEAWFSLAELMLHTGRRHQARRHLHRINHPVVGDNKHGDKAYNRWAASRTGEKHLFLRSIAVTVRHPENGATIQTRLAIPDLWRDFLESLGMQVPEEYLDDGVVCTPS